MQKLRRKMHKNWPRLLVAGLLILHDSAYLHIADDVTKKNFAIMGGMCYLMHPNSPYMNQPDFDLFPKLKGPMRGWCFCYLVELSTDITWAIRHMNKSGVFDGIIMLPKHWDSVIEKQGDYIEVLWTGNLKEIKMLIKEISHAIFLKWPPYIYIISVFCPRAGLLLQTQAPRLQFLLGIDRCGGEKNGFC